MRKCIPIAKQLVTVFSLLLILASCSSSHIYNPALNLPAKPLKQGEINVSGNFAYAPEARPAATVASISPMGAASVRIGVIDNLMVQAEGWTDFTPEDFFRRGGYAFSAMYTFKTNENSVLTYGIMPKYGFVLEGDFFSDGLIVPGHGISISALAYLNREESKLKPYFGITPIYAFQDLSDLKDRDGYGVALQAGFNYEFNSWLNMNLELPLVFQQNNYDDIAHLIPAPTIGVSVDLSVIRSAE